MTLQIDQFVELTGGMSDKGKNGQVSDLSDPMFVGVRIPNIAKARATVYVTRDSVRAAASASAGQERQ
jgi:hypothetical protein